MIFLCKECKTWNVCFVFFHKFKAYQHLRSLALGAFFSALPGSGASFSRYCNCIPSLDSELLEFLERENLRPVAGFELTISVLESSALITELISSLYFL